MSQELVAAPRSQDLSAQLRPFELVQLHDESSRLSATLEVMELQQPGLEGTYRHLSRASPIVDALGRLGLLSTSSSGVVKMTLSSDTATRIAAGSAHYLGSSGGRFYGQAVDSRSGNILELATLSHANLQVVGPQLLWSAAAFVVGQHFQAEINGRLAAIEGRLEALKAHLIERDLSELASARKGVREVALRLLDGEPPSIVDGALNAQTQAIGAAWATAVARLGILVERVEKRSKDPSIHKLYESMTTIFADEGRALFSDVRTFVVALEAKLELISVRLAQVAASPAGGESQFLVQLNSDLDECREAFDTCKDTLRTLARLPLAGEGGGLRGRGNERRVQMLRVVEQVRNLDDELREHLRLPLVSDNIRPISLLIESSPTGIGVRITPS